MDQDPTLFTIRFLGIIAAIFVLVVGVRLFSIARKNGRLWSTGTLLEIAAEIAFFVFIFGLLCMQDAMAWYGLGDAWSIPIIIALVIPIPLTAYARWTFARRTARANPVAGPPASAVKPSAEETSVSLKFAALTLAVGLILLLPVFLTTLRVAREPIELVSLGLLTAYAALSLGVLTFGLVGRWPGKVSSKASIEIDAPVETVWNAIRFRETDAWWNRSVRRIEALPGSAERYRMHYFNTETCPSCTLARNPETQGETILVEIKAHDAPTFLHWTAAPFGADGKPGAMLAHEEEWFRLEALPSGRCRITASDTVVGAKVWAALLFKLGDPLGQHLLAVKAAVEGCALGSLQETGVKRLDAVRQSARYCGCPKAG